MGIMIYRKNCEILALKFVPNDSFFSIIIEYTFGVVSIVVYVTLIIELIFMLSMVTVHSFKDIHYYIFLLIFLDSIVRLIIQPSRSFGYARLIFGLCAIIPILNYQGIQLLPFDINLGMQQGILFLLVNSTKALIFFI